MLYQLKNNISMKSGFKIKTRGDCVRLASMISIETEGDISYNTLRRFYGIVQGTSPSEKTLNILSKYVGFESYKDFCFNYPQKKNWAINQKIYNTFYCDSELSLTTMEEEFSKQEEYIDLLIALTSGVALIQDFRILKKIFNSKLLNPSRFNYSELLYFGNCVGPIFRDLKTDYCKLINTRFFNSHVYNTFVDLDSLNGNYGSYNELIFNSTNDPEQKLFSNCLLELRNFLNKKKVREVSTILTIKNIHPILYGRYIGVGAFLSSNTSIKDNILNFLALMENRKDKVEFLYELMFAIMLSKKIDLLKLIVNSTRDYKISKPFYQEYHYSLFNIRDAIVKLYNGGNISSEIKYLKGNTLFRNSHRNFIDLFISILDYHNSKNKKSKLEGYKKIAKKLNYPLFDEDYCLSYFR